MSITAEQFNKIVLKEDLERLEEKIDGKVDKKIDKILTIVDGIAKKLDNSNTEKFANIAAHDRIQTDVNEVRGQIGLDIKNPVVNDGE